MTDTIRRLFGRKGRAVLYALVGAVCAVLLLLGIIDQPTIDGILANSDKVLGIIASVLALFNLTPEDGLIEEA